MIEMTCIRCKETKPLTNFEPTAAGYKKTCYKCLEKQPRKKSEKWTSKKLAELKELALDMTAKELSYYFKTTESALRNTLLRYKIKYKKQRGTTKPKKRKTGADINDLISGKWA